MRNATLCLVLLFGLPACQPKPAETTAPPLPAATTPPAAAGPTVAQRFSPILTGHWVSAQYLDAVRRTRSPLTAFDQVPAPASLEIRPFATQQDSVEIGASYSMHEGGSLTLLLRPTTDAKSLLLRNSYGSVAGSTTELCYQITARDTTLFLQTRQGQTHRLLTKIAYRRTGLPTKELDLEAGIGNGINKLLLTGVYNGLDSIRQPVHVQFFTNGSVKGLPFRKYFVQIDFAGPTPGDAISFDVYTKHQLTLAASFGRDTLKLYTVRSFIGVPAGKTDTTEIFERGRLRYQFVRVKRP